ncbi:MAG: response regulator [Promethearchaeota archaeon]
MISFTNFENYFISIDKTPTDAIIFDISQYLNTYQDLLSKLIQKLPNVPIILLTDFFNESISLNFFKAGAQEYIQKCQLSNISLSHIIKNTIERKKLEQNLIKTEKLETIGSLAGGIAHDFNNVLTSIIGNLSLMEMDIDQKKMPETWEQLKSAQNSASRAQKLSNQLLTFAKGGDPIKKSTNLIRIIQNSASFSLQGSKSRCSLEIEPNLWNAQIDSNQISQVLNTIIINADQSMSNGGIIKIRANNQLITQNAEIPISLGKYICITIEDGGIGIPKEDLDKLFNSYFSSKPNGTGLGLMISHSIIHKHNGYIKLESDVGKGTKCSIYLPAIYEQEAEIPKNIITFKTRTEMNHPRVLIMDDEARIRKVLCKMLDRLGYETIMTKDGDEMIQTYEKLHKTENPIELLIVDLTIPGGLGGREALARLREKYPKIKAIVASGYSNDPVMANFAKYGFIDVLKKPFNISTLKNVLSNHISLS